MIRDIHTGFRFRKSHRIYLQTQQLARIHEPYFLFLFFFKYTLIDVFFNIFYLLYECKFVLLRFFRKHSIDKRTHEMRGKLVKINNTNVKS